MVRKGVTSSGMPPDRGPGPGDASDTMRAEVARLRNELADEEALTRQEFRKYKMSREKRPKPLDKPKPGSRGKARRGSVDAGGRAGSGRRSSLSGLPVTGIRLLDTSIRDLKAQFDTGHRASEHNRTSFEKLLDRLCSVDPRARDVRLPRHKAMTAGLWELYQANGAVDTRDFKTGLCLVARDAWPVRLGAIYDIAGGLEAVSEPMQLALLLSALDPLSRPGAEEAREMAKEILEDHAGADGNLYKKDFVSSLTADAALARSLPFTPLFSRRMPLTPRAP